MAPLPARSHQSIHSYPLCPCRFSLKFTLTFEYWSVVYYSVVFQHKEVTSEIEAFHYRILLFHFQKKQ